MRARLPRVPFVRISWIHQKVWYGFEWLLLESFCKVPGVQIIMIPGLTMGGLMVGLLGTSLMSRSQRTDNHATDD